MKYKAKNIIMYMLLIYTMFLFAPFTANIYAQSNSTAEIEIISGTGPTFPVNPENPEENLPGGEGVPGALAIVNITPLNFGTISVSEREGIYDIVTNQPNIQVVDLRGTETGWSVTASITQFQNQGIPSLPSAVIHIIDGRPNSIISNLYAPHQIANVRLTTDNTPVKVITAPDGTGMGLWVIRWYSQEEGERYIKLEIPSGAATKGMHTATINWILSDIP